MHAKNITPPGVHLAFGMLSFLLGFAFIFGGDARASAKSYSVIAHNGGPFIWGTILVVLGVALILSVDRMQLMRLLLMAGAVAYGLLALAFAISAVVYPDANLTAVVAYGGYSAFHLCAWFKSKREMVDLKDVRRAGALRALLDNFSADNIDIRSGDDKSERCCIVLDRAASILSDDWQG